MIDLRDVRNFVLDGQRQGVRGRQAQHHKKGKKVSWKRLDCQDELHRSVTYNKFTTLTPGKEEQQFDEILTIRIDYSSQGDMWQKKGEHE